MPSLVSFFVSAGTTWRSSLFFSGSFGYLTSTLVGSFLAPRSAQVYYPLVTLKYRLPICRSSLLRIPVSDCTQSSFLNCQTSSIVFPISLEPSQTTNFPALTLQGTVIEYDCSFHKQVFPDLQILLGVYNTSSPTIIFTKQLQSLSDFYRLKISTASIRKDIASKASFSKSISKFAKPILVNWFLSQALYVCFPAEGLRKTSRSMSPYAMSLSVVYLFLFKTKSSMLRPQGLQQLLIGNTNVQLKVGLKPPDSCTAVDLQIFEIRIFAQG